jgi:alpha-amylase
MLCLCAARYTRCLLPVAAGGDTAFHGAGQADSGLDFVAAPDLDHANPELRAGLTDWLTWLQQDVGFEGWRFDYSRG